MQGRIDPIVLQVLALSGIVIGVVAGCAEGHSGDKTAIDGGIEGSPGSRRRPTRVARDTFAGSSIVDGRARDGVSMGAGQIRYRILIRRGIGIAEKREEDALEIAC